jgi:hypothetical protein
VVALDKASLVLLLGWGGGVSFVACLGSVVACLDFVDPIILEVIVTVMLLDPKFQTIDTYLVVNNEEVLLTGAYLVADRRLFTNSENEKDPQIRPCVDSGLLPPFQVKHHQTLVRVTLHSKNR